MKQIPVESTARFTFPPQSHDVATISPRNVKKPRRDKQQSGPDLRCEFDSERDSRQNFRGHRWTDSVPKVPFSESHEGFSRWAGWVEWSYLFACVTSLETLTSASRFRLRFARLSASCLQARFHSLVADAAISGLPLCGLASGGQDERGQVRLDYGGTHRFGSPFCQDATRWVFILFAFILSWYFSAYITHMALLLLEL